MLARTGSLPDRGDARWVSEVKWDGIRAQLRIDRGSLTLRTRPGRNATSEFPELAALGETLCTHRVLLDGELVCLDDDGRPDFAAVIGRMAGGDRSGGRPVLLQLFDVLHLDGEPVRALPYQQRRELLSQIRELLPPDPREFRAPSPTPRISTALRSRWGSKV
jgi:bifunctional non-homologous end joining protein LigD